MSNLRVWCPRCGCTYSTPAEMHQLLGAGVERFGRGVGDRCGDWPPGAEPCDGIVIASGSRGTVLPEDDQLARLGAALVDNAAIPELEPYRMTGRRRRLALMMQVMHERGTVVDLMTLREALMIEAGIDVEFLCSLPIPANANAL